jgi:putative nucleotidyltransferase with HDIG domain
MKRVGAYIHSKVARRTFFLFVVSALLPVCGLALVSLHRVSARLEQDSFERLRQASKNAGMAIFEGLNLLQVELESIPVTSGADSGRIFHRAARMGRDRSFHAVAVKKDAAGKWLIPGMPRLSPASHAHLAAGNALLLATSGPGAGDPLRMATSVNHHLPRNTLLVAEVNPANLWSLVENSLSPGIDICILGPSGKSLYVSRPLSPSLVTMVMSRQREASSGQLIWQGRSDEYLVNYWPVFLKPAFQADSWTVIAVQSRQNSRGTARPFITMFLLVILLTLGVVIFISSILIRRSLVPLAILKQGASRLSSGDFDARVEIRSGDEFEELASSFNNMSQQLGMHFTRQKEMGKLVQSILESHDLDDIINTVMLRFRRSVPCEWLGVAVADAHDDSKMLMLYNHQLNNAVSGIVRFEALLNGDELESTRSTAGNLHVLAGQGFAALLAPMVTEGAKDFFLLPIAIKDRLLGILILGFRCAPDQVREDLVCSRQVADEMAISLDNIRLIHELHWLNLGAIEALANAVDAKSPWTAGHSERVTKLALSIGKEMGLSPPDLETLQLAGMFHDMGKIGVPEVILDKPGRLTDEEYALIKKHPEKGAEILKPIRAYHGAIPIVAQHHEQFDGRGYPLGLAGEEIVLGARIMAVADVFDALHSDRPYRQGWEIDRVFSHLENMAGSQFDPEVVRVFLNIERSLYLEAPIVTSGMNPERA